MSKEQEGKPKSAQPKPTTRLVQLPSGEYKRVVINDTTKK